MLNLPILRWGQPYTSLEQDTVKHFITGETLAKVSQANTGLLGRDMRQARRAREELIGIPIAELIEMMKTAGDLYLNGTLPMGDGEQTPDDFVFSMKGGRFITHMKKLRDVDTPADLSPQRAS